jgi:hypothetical protein
MPTSGGEKASQFETLDLDEGLDDNTDGRGGLESTSSASGPGTNSGVSTTPRSTETDFVSDDSGNSDDGSDTGTMADNGAAALQDNSATVGTSPKTPPLNPETIGNDSRPVTAIVTNLIALKDAMDAPLPSKAVVLMTPEAVRRGIGGASSDRLLESPAATHVQQQEALEKQQEEVKKEKERKQEEAKRKQEEAKKEKERKKEENRRKEEEAKKEKERKKEENRRKEEEDKRKKEEAKKGKHRKK